MPLTDSNVWAIRGKVVHGHGRGGSMLGFPTANIELDEKTTEALMDINNSVSYGWGKVERGEHAPDVSTDILPVVFSVGFNPHFKDKALTLEVHFINKFDKDFYGATIRVIGLGVMRKMGAFTTLEDLIKTIQGDCDNAHNLLKEKNEWKKCPFLLNEPLNSDEPLPKLLVELTQASSL